MATATLNRSLTDEMAERWRTTQHRASEGVGDSAVEDVAHTALNALTSGYWQSEDGNHPPLGNAWMEQLEAAALSAATAAWDEHVIPAMIAALLPLISVAPPHLVAYPGSEQLRADLALLEQVPA